MDSDQRKEELYAKTKDEYLEEYVKGKEPTAEDAKAFLEENLKYLDFTENLGGIQWPDGLLDAQKAVTNDNGELPFGEEFKSELFDTFSESKYPVERFYAYECMGNLSSEERLAFYKKRFKAEDDPAVLIKMIWIVRDRREEAADQDILDFYTAMTDHENPLVRAAASNITFFTCFSKDENAVEVTVNNIVKLLGDEDVEVKDLAAAFSDMAPRDMRVIEALKAILENDADMKAHGSASEALQCMWTGYPSYKETSQEAYLAFLEYLKREPRNADIPTWRGVSPLVGISKDKFDAFAATLDFYNAEELGNIYSAILQDANAGNLARGEAVEGIAIYGTYDQFVAAKTYIDSIEEEGIRTALLDAYDKGNEALQ